MQKFFNTAGPVNQDEHYKLDPLSRFDLEEIEFLIAQKKYFIMHAPRQTGKTSCLLALREYLNSQDDYFALYINVEAGQAYRNNIDAVQRVIIKEIEEQLKQSDIPLKNNDIYEPESLYGFSYVRDFVANLCRMLSKPLVLMIDEIDALVGDSLISVLRQIRAGYTSRPESFPQSIILCGVRDVKDYRIHTSGQDIITGGSAFNIKARSLKLGNFTIEDIKNLYLEHTKETGQIFEEDCFPLVWEYTEGQPWLVNALGFEITFEMKKNRDRSVHITPQMIKSAKENLIMRRETHLDQLSDKLKEERVHNVISYLLASSDQAVGGSNDDIEYVMDLGLITKEVGSNYRISNAIYKEVIPRELTWSTQGSITEDRLWYLNPDGRLNMEKLMQGFQNFFRKNSESWIERFDYKAAGPQLLMQAYLQRIVNGGGFINREYGLGMMRTDLHVQFPYGDNQWQEEVIELKIIHDSYEQTLAKGLTQTSAYIDKCGTADGHLVIFNRDTDTSWDEKITYNLHHFQGKDIHVWGM
ncbi:AAA-like domain-containing protein [Saccharicrinis sp. 156]|uniref:AAA-like domain-containing protein n=1 Tax=Saccharicrinis sp. 156 TaxID=3417574 RepID=UPI003D34262D